MPTGLFQEVQVFIFFIDYICNVLVADRIPQEFNQETCTPFSIFLADFFTIDSFWGK